MTTKYIHRVLVGAALGAAVALPGFALADDATSTDQSRLQARIAELQAKIAQMQAMLQNGTASSSMRMMHEGEEHDMPGMMGSSAEDHMRMGSSTMMHGEGHPFCIKIERNLGLGSRGDDVKQLQLALASSTDFSANNATGVFGRVTAAALAKFQATFNVASSSTGSVGPKTRAFFMQNCGQGMGVAGSTTPDRIFGMGSSTMPRGDDHHMGSSAMMHGGEGHWMPGMTGSSTQQMPPMGMRGDQGERDH